jgi:hypothetical protein
MGSQGKKGGAKGSLGEARGIREGELERVRGS